MGKGLELVTYLGDDYIGFYHKMYKNKYDYIWGQYFTDSEEVRMMYAVCKTSYNDREIIITINQHL